MLERINGYADTGRLGYFYGDNAIVSIAISGTDGIKLKSTGATCSFAELKRSLNTDDMEFILSHVNTKGIIRVDGTEFVLDTLAEDFDAAFAAQTNYKRIVDIVQQRAVVLGISDVESGVTAVKFSTHGGGVTAEDDVADAEVVSFLVERRNVFDKNLTTFQGVPDGKIEVGRNLIDDLIYVPMITKLTDPEVKLLDNFGIKVYDKVPALYA